MPLLSGKKIVSIYFGGGTPTLFAPDGIREILSWIHGSDLLLSEDCEITIEGNPEGLEFSLLCSLRDLGVNRLSLGVQSLDDSSLAVLERRHSAVQAKKAIDAAFSADFQNISIDLMYDLPGQTEESWAFSLSQLKQLPLTHLSLYNLTFEPHTSFYLRKASLQKTLPSDALSLRLLQMGVEACEAIGLIRYEISAFAREGFASRHNSGYWTGRPFLGFGPSAFSYWEGSRFRNNSHLQRYRRLYIEGKSGVEFEEKLSYPADLKERLAIQLRLLSGVDIHSWPLPAETLASLQSLKERNYLLNHESHWRLSSLGMLFYDTVAEELI